MNEFQQVLQGLPPWAQAIAVIVVVVGGGLLGRRARKATNARRSHPKSVRTRSQKGVGGTVDLTREEVQRLRLSYDPHIDGSPDPGEVVWAWVPFVENDGRGKDRPVLVIARLNDTTVAGCYLSTKQHRNFIHLGTGSWDSQGRPSYLNPQRVLRIDEGNMRREGAIVDREQYERVMKDFLEFSRS